MVNKRRLDYEEFAEMQEIVESYRRNTSNYGKRFHKTRLNGSYDSSKDRVNSSNFEEFADDAYWMTEE
jgi:hypothetical protein